MLQSKSARGLWWILALLFTLEASGCHSWRLTPQPWPESLEKKPAGRYRITMLDSRRFEADWVRIRGDSLSAGGRQAYPNQPNGTLGLALSDVARLDERRADGVKTGILVGGILAVCTLSWLAFVKAVESIEVPVIVLRPAR